MLRLIVAAVAAASAASAIAGWRVGHPRLDELSGLAQSRADPGVLWAVNDSGGGARLFRLGPQGQDLGKVTVPGARNADWEDLAAFRAPEGPALLIADVGDNLEFRSFVSLYAVLEPGPGARRARLLWRLDFRFPEGSNDCEAMAIDETRREILLISKREDPPQLYRLKLPQAPPPAGYLARAEKLGPVAGLPQPTAEQRTRMPLRARFMHTPTGLAIARDGRSALLITPEGAYRYRRRANQGWGEVFARRGAPMKLPDFRQIEAGALAADGKGAWIGAEASPSELAWVPFPARPATPREPAPAKARRPKRPR